jgi:HNH endonuclease
MTKQWPYRPDWADRFYAKITKVEASFKREVWDLCHVWAGMKDNDGYGRFKLKGKRHAAHRVAWSLAYGPIPVGWHICHKCDVPSCCNPSHLFLGTGPINTADRDAKGRQADTRGERNASARLTAAQVLEIRADQELSQRALAAKYGVSEATVGRFVLQNLEALIPLPATQGQARWPEGRKASKGQANQQTSPRNQSASEGRQGIGNQVRLERLDYPRDRIPINFLSPSRLEAPSGAKLKDRGRPKVSASLLQRGRTSDALSFPRSSAAITSASISPCWLSASTIRPLAESRASAIAPRGLLQ